MQYPSYIATRCLLTPASRPPRWAAFSVDGPLPHVRLQAHRPGGGARARRVVPRAGLRIRCPLDHTRGTRSVSETEQNIEALLSELRVFDPTAAFTRRAIVSEDSIYERAERD